MMMTQLGQISVNVASILIKCMNFKNNLHFDQ